MAANRDTGADTGPAARMPGYWAFQFLGWSAFAVLSILSLNVWYNPGELAPALHSIVQSLIGVIVSHPLRWVARQTWNLGWIARVALNGLAVLAASQLWTVLRLYAFTWMTGLPIGPEDWGGWIFGSLTVFACWAFCYHALKYYREWFEQREVSIRAQNAVLAAEAHAHRETAMRLQAENLVRESKLRLLNHQLNPHFFFNALNSVTALVRKNDKEAAMEMLSRIGDFLRVSLDGDDALMHPLRDEIEIVTLYLGIEKVRFGDRMHVEFNVDDDAMDVRIPSLMLQPLVENSIKHAVGKSLSRTTIRLDASVTNDSINIRLSDDGPGAAAGSQKLRHGAPGIGLKNVEDRLKAVYGDQFTLTTETGRSAGFSIRLSVPRKAPSAEATITARRETGAYIAGQSENA